MNNMKTYWDTLNRTYNYKETPDLDYLTDFINRNCQSIVEFSTGAGIIPTMLRNRGWRGLYTGTDYCDSFLGWAKENNPEEKFIKEDLLGEISLGDNYTDACVVHHGMEYVYPYKLALEEMKRIAKKYVLITFWVPFGTKNEIRFNEEGKWNVNFYEREEFYKTLEEVGLKIVREVTFKDTHYNHLLILEV